MIELISESRCTGCNICVRVCPVNVFDAVPQAAPTIARKADCQTCFMCELYCPEDALYVAPIADRGATAPLRLPKKGEDPTPADCAPPSPPRLKSPGCHQ